MPGKAENGWQLYCFLLSGGFGFWLGTAYSLYGMVRDAAARRLGRWGWDVCFCLTAAWMLFLFSLPLTGGRLRWYLLCGVAVGFFAGRATLGRLLSRAALWGGKLFSRLYRTIAAAFHRFFRFLLRPIAKITTGFQKVWQKGRKNSKKLLQQSRAMVYNRHKGRMG